ncbi:N-acetyl-gamma-glutamyl-phosphate reductase [bacterium]|nr:N-acetyl-gamma-glutamyl-phosphate reductase [bacterium]
MGNKLKVGIVGATGYTGSELVRLQMYHPKVEIAVITSESHAGKQFTEVHPQFRGLVDIELRSLEEFSVYSPDLVFLALPHGVSMDFIQEHGYDKYKVIDLSGDFRLNSQDIYEKWYKREHTSPEDLKEAEFGLPELFRDKIKSASFIANPGCYPTSAILALAPLLKEKLIDPLDIVVDSKSGVTGAGAKPKSSTHFPDVFGDFSAYGLIGHRHTPEIQYVLEEYSEGEVELLFIPHLLPIDRGILTTTYSKPVKPVSDDSLLELYKNLYDDEPFVRLSNIPPSVKNVRGSNFCDIYATYNDRTNRIITVSVIDNLVKGAAGQAIQNMNILMGFEETEGLTALPLSP